MEYQNKSCLHKGSTEATFDVECGGLRQEDETKTVYANSMTAREMESLVAICDTLIPSLDASEVAHLDDSVAQYYSASASHTGTPDRVSVSYIYTNMHLHTSAMTYAVHMHEHIIIYIDTNYILTPKKIPTIYVFYKELQITIYACYIAYIPAFEYIDS